MMQMRVGTVQRVSVFVMSLGCLLVLAGGRAAFGQQEMASRTKVGDKMPLIAAKELSGDTFSVAAERGKVVVVSFWATWCEPCMVEMPRLEKEIWEKYKSPEFAMVGIAREQTEEVVAAFQHKHPAFTYPLAYDPHRAAYALFADAGIPRVYVVDRHGVIVYQSLGYDPGAIGALDAAIQKALAAK
jgi:peroxiredoxin